MLRILLLVVLLRLLIATDKFRLCAALYAGFLFILELVMIFLADSQVGFVTLFVALLIRTAIRFGLILFYFWLLHRYSDGFLWWVIMVLGVVSILFLLPAVGLDV